MVNLPTITNLIRYQSFKWIYIVLFDNMTDLLLSHRSRKINGPISVTLSNGMTSTFLSSEVLSYWTCPNFNHVEMQI